MSASPYQFQWISIPGYAQTGQAHAFANREDEMNQLYRLLVSAGNAVRSRTPGEPLRCVVSGYMGTGKSALFLQTLGMLRNSFQVVPGQQVPLPIGLPEPLEPERWIILRSSGKRVPSFDSLADELRKAITAVLDEVGREAGRQVPSALELPLLHRLFHSKEAREFADVRSALQTLSLTIEYVRFWYGSAQVDKTKSGLDIETTESAEASLEAALKGKGSVPKTTEAKAAMKAAASFVVKEGRSLKNETELERRITINADLVVDALNKFFDTATDAGLPTILLLDDFDEFATHESPFYNVRVQILGTLLRVFSTLRPTCLLIGLRQEYVTGDVRRQYKHQVFVPPMTPASTRLALEAWARVQQPALEPIGIQELLALGDRFLSVFPDGPTVIPFRFLQLVAWLANQNNRQRPNRDIVLAYLSVAYSGEVVRAVVKVGQLMPASDVELCLRAEPLAPEPYVKLSKYERVALEHADLLRPANAGSADDPRILLDPLCSYVK